jgi:hypothetical protein
MHGIHTKADIDDIRLSAGILHLLPDVQLAWA